MDKTNLLIILSVAAFYGILKCIQTKGIFHKVITIGLAFSILIAWIKVQNILLIAMLFIFLMSVMTGIYGISNKKISLLERFSISTLGLTMVIGTMFKLLHWPGANIIILSMLIPIITYLICLTVYNSYTKKEWSFMIIWMVMAVNEVIRFWKG